MTNALGIVQSAYRQANMDQVPQSFSTSLEFPYNIGLDLMNTVLQELNQLGRYSFSQSTQELPYATNTNTYDLNTVATNPVQPEDIIKLRREATNYQGDLSEMNYRAFQRRYDVTGIPTEMPSRWSYFNYTLYLNFYPDQDYTITMYYYQDIPLAVNTTDTLIVPVVNEDVLRDGIYAYLCERIGRPDFQPAYQLYLTKAKKIVAKQNKSAGMPRQMPGAF
jgi:hypothetical protein